MMKKLREEGFQIGRYKVRHLMLKLNLKVTQRLAYKITTKRNHRDEVADNSLNQNYNPVSANQVWAADITYLKNRWRLDVFSHHHGAVFTLHGGLVHQ